MQRATWILGCALLAMSGTSHGQGVPIRVKVPTYVPPVQVRIPQTTFPKTNYRLTQPSAIPQLKVHRSAIPRAAVAQPARVQRASRWNSVSRSYRPRSQSSRTASRPVVVSPPPPPPEEPGQDDDGGGEEEDDDEDEDEDKTNIRVGVSSPKVPVGKTTRVGRLWNWSKDNPFIAGGLALLMLILIGSRLD